MDFSSGREHSRLKRHVIDNTIITLMLLAGLVLVSKLAIRNSISLEPISNRLVVTRRDGTAKAAMELLTC